MTSAINIVVSCTNRKKFQSAPELHLRSVHGSLEARAKQWLERLQTHEAPTVEASDLYSGDHWSIARGLEAVAAQSGLTATLWICSAGYGLIRPHAQIKSYAATFSAGHADSVGRPSDENPRNSSRAWWQSMMGWSGPTPGAPRSLEQIAHATPEAPMMVVLSQTYLDAVTDDVKRAEAALANKDHLLIISAGGDPIAGLEAQQIPCDARMQAHVGGAMQALNARLARDILLAAQRIEMSASSVRRHLEELLANQPARIDHNRAPLTDFEVRQFIQEALERNPSARHTPLLRELRASGRACEQSRFSTLFRAVLGGQYDSQ